MSYEKAEYGTFRDWWLTNRNRSKDDRASVEPFQVVLGSPRRSLGESALLYLYQLVIAANMEGRNGGN